MHMVLQLLHLEYRRRQIEFQSFDAYIYYKNPANLAVDPCTFTKKPT